MEEPANYMCEGIDDLSLSETMHVMLRKKTNSVNPTLLHAVKVRKERERGGSILRIAGHRRVRAYILPCRINPSLSIPPEKQKHEYCKQTRIFFLRKMFFVFLHYLEPDSTGPCRAWTSAAAWGRWSRGSRKTATGSTRCSRWRWRPPRCSSRAGEADGGA